ncbi:glycosyltransferase family 2 protein [Flavobacterium flavigenum]|uniref:glycosyltransferase family 2 protein n=1 Tax=Flavobacterium flavigenum TaxID=3003258 RepID=UPI002482493A|nr:glycosyltransferase family 2 protein [Flavobacterium flavigenum]
MKISIIVATYNAASYLERLIESVNIQNSDNLELIIIDGGSKDDTVNLIKKHLEKVSFWISEPDKGIYDAWNKGVVASSGDWIMFLGADDQLLPGAIEKYLGFMSKLPSIDQVDYISSRMKMVDLTGHSIRVKGWPWEWPLFLKDMTVAHPGSLHSKRLFDQYGLFDISYKITGDYELLLRPQEKLKAVFFDEITVLMQEGGASDSLKALLEHERAAVQTGGASATSARLNVYKISLKFRVKAILRKMGFNAYLKK